MLPPASFDLSAAVRRADEALRRGALRDATQLIGDLKAFAPRRPEPWLLQARLDQLEGDYLAMLAATREAVTLAPADLVAALLCVEAEILSGETASALQRLGAIVERHGDNPAALRRAGEAYTQLGNHLRADRCAQAALELRPDDLDVCFQAAACALVMGRMEEAETRLDKILAQNLDEFDAAYNRATLRAQTGARNHVNELQTSLARVGAERAPAALWYALGKELEDLGENEPAFDCIECGAARRRQTLAYDVAADEAAMRSIAAHFGVDFFARDGDGYESETPIFVVGLPRTGTTLVDRILNRHPQVESRGELNDLALAVMRASARAPDKSQRIARTARADMRALGEGYARAVRGAGASAPFFVDKTPLNFLYLGIVARALPNARIIHLARHPMASGYAMLKTLFRMGYPFSYAQEDIARYQLAYQGLMNHWRSHLGTQILDLSYESLVDDQEAETRRLLAHCGLEWRDECLAFHDSASPTATASAAQVRRPLYRDSRDQWRSVAHRLDVLRTRLSQGGVEVG